MRTSEFTASCLTSISLLALAGTASGQYETRTIAMKFDSALGPNAGTSLVGFGAPLINNAGDVVFTARALFDGGFPYDAVYMAKPTGLELVARSRGPAPGLEPTLLFEMNGYSLDDRGNVYLWASLIDPNPIPSGSSAIWQVSPESGRVIARRTELAPGTFARWESFDFDNGGLPNPNNAGNSVFTASLIRGFDGVDETNDFGLWADIDGQARLVARTGDAAPLRSGETIRFLRRQAFINNTNQVAFNATLADSDGELTSNVLYAGPIDNPQVIGVEGDEVTNLPGAFITRYAPFAYSDSGDVWINTNLVDKHGELYGFFSEAAIIRVTPQQERFVAWQQGTDAVGVDGHQFERGPGGRLKANDAGDVVITSGLRQNTSPSQFVDTGVGLWVAPGSGAPLQHIADSITTDSMIDGWDLTRVANASINNRGDVVFLGGLFNPNVGSTLALYVFEQATDQLHQILWTGELFDVDDDPFTEDLREISRLNIQFPDGSHEYINDFGTVAFHLEFTDGSEGIFTITIPAPASSVTLAAFGSVLTRRRR